MKVKRGEKMANELQRVGLVFTQEGAVDFKKTLQEINLEMNKNYNQFKLTQAQWDSSTKSTEKLRAQQDYLTNAYQIQQDRVNTLRMQLEELENSENKNTTAINKKRNELTKAEIKLQDYNSRLKEVDAQLNNTGKKIEEFGTKIENVGKKMENAGKKVSAFSVATGTALVASAKSAIEFESAFTGVEKTVDGTEEQLQELKQGIRDMAKELPSTTTEISAVAEAAGQLGIKTENVLDFSKAMIDLGNSTNLTADEAASQLAKFANIMQMSQKDFDKLGSAIVDLGNNFATTEADIVNMSMRLAGAGKQVGLSEGQVLGLATALSSVGIEAEMGGSAISKAMVKMQNAVEQGGTKLNTVLKKTGMTLRDLELMAANDSKGFKEMSQSIGMTSTEVKQLITAGTNLEDFAKISGMTTEQFKKAWKEDAAGALTAFIKGLGDAEDKGESAITMLSEMGLTEVRLRDSLLRAANAGNLFNDAIKTGTKAWEDNTALTNEANKRYGTLESKIKICINKLKDFAITIGNKLMPSIEKIVDQIGNFAEWLSKLSDEQVNNIVKIGLMVTAIGPLLSIVGKLTSTVGGVVKTIGTFTQAIGVAIGKTTSSATSVNNLANIFGTLSNPIGLTTVAIGSLIAAYTAHQIAVTQEKASLEGLREEVENQSQSWQSLAQTRNKTLSGNLSEIENTSRLAEELKKITEENGNVKQGYEDRAQVILNQLNSALGTEYTLNGNMIAQYQELKSNIDQIIEKKKAEAVLNAYQEEYKTAIKEEAAGTKTLVGLKQQLADAAERMATGNAKERKEAEILYSSIAQQIGEQTELIGQYGKTIQDYDNLKTASVSGNAQQIQEATKSIMTSYEEVKQASQQTIEEQINTQTEYMKVLKKYLSEAEKTNDEYQTNVLNSQLETEQQKLANLINSLVEQTSTIQELTPQQIEAWKAISDGSYTEYSNGLMRLPEEVRNRIQESTGIIALDTTMPDAAGNKAISTTNVFDRNLTLPEKTQDQIGKSAELLRNDTTIQNEGGGVGSRTSSSFVNSADGEQTGIDFLQGLLTGLRNGWMQKQIIGVANSLGDRVSSSAAKSKVSTSSLPGHKSGLDYVPYDDYVARLHKGERVLTAKENKQLMNTEKTIKNNSNSNDLGTLTVDIDYDQMANAITKALTNCKFTLDEDGFAKIVKDELYKVV